MFMISLKISELPLRMNITWAHRRWLLLTFSPLSLQTLTSSTHVMSDFHLSDLTLTRCVTHLPLLRITVQLGQQSWLTRHRLGNKPTPTAWRPLWSLTMNPLQLIWKHIKHDITFNVSHVFLKQRDWRSRTSPRMCETLSTVCGLLERGQKSKKLWMSTLRSFMSSSGMSQMWSSSSSMVLSCRSDTTLPSLSVRHMTRAARLKQKHVEL